jgi:hypothetical protein
VDGSNKKCEDCQLKYPSFGLPGEAKKNRWCAGCAKGHAGAVNVSKKLCEDCQLKGTNYGLPAEGKPRWCGGCAKAHAGAVDVKTKKCEVCQLKLPSFYLPGWREEAGGGGKGWGGGGKKQRWCGDCAPKGVLDHRGRMRVESSPHTKRGATDPPLTHKMCEGCQLKQANFGLPGEVNRWCGGCAKGHAGAVGVKHKKCDDCQLKHPNFGLPAEGKRRWCAGCAKAHAGAVNVTHKKCEVCQLKLPSFGLPGEGKKKRWCGDCAPKGAQGARARTAGKLAA